MASRSMVEQLEEQPPVEKPRIDNPEEEEEIGSSNNKSNLPKSTGMIEHKVFQTSTMDSMTSMNTNMEAHSDKEQPPAKKPRIDEGSAEPNGMKADEQKEELETSTTTTVDLPRPRHRKLPAELNREIYLCFNETSQRKFIYRLGWDFYAMFRYRLLRKTKRVRNPHGNLWDRANTRATVMADGLSVRNNVGVSVNVFAEQPFPISGPHCRVDEFPGTILYYYEVKGKRCNFGFSDGAIPENLRIGEYSNSYAVRIDHFTEDYVGELPARVLRTRPRPLNTWARGVRPSPTTPHFGLA